MASDVKKTKSTPAPKAEAPAKKTKEAAATAESTPAADAPKEAAKEAATADSGSEKSSDRPASYSRGEGQKVVTQAYRDNWNAIFGDKKKKKR